MDPFLVAAFQWQEGERRVREAPPGQQHLFLDVVDAIVAELRRRLGGPFSSDELATLYTAEGTGWAAEVAQRAAPEDPSAWDPRVCVDAAFARYLREAVDYAGGRRLFETS